MGTLVGTLAVYGGALTTRSCGCHWEAGTVQLSDDQGAPLVMHVAKSGRFSAQVPPGQYVVKAAVGGAAGWPLGSCRLLLIADKPGARPKQHRYLTVRPSQTTHAAIGCIGE
jgi:hypothetical protein